jgi:hypothetical protein
MQVKPVMLDLYGGFSAGTSKPFRAHIRLGPFLTQGSVQAGKGTGLNLAFRGSIPKH